MYIFLTKHKCSQIFHVTLLTVCLSQARASLFNASVQLLLGDIYMQCSPPMPKWSLPPTSPHCRHTELPMAKGAQTPVTSASTTLNCSGGKYSLGPLYIKQWSSPYRVDHPKAKLQLFTLPPLQRLSQPRNCLPPHGASSSALWWGCGTCWLPLPFLLPI